MEFSLDRFYSLNRRAIIWIVLFGLIWLLKDFFTLVFLTFITAFFAFQASRFLMDRFHLNRVVTITGVHLAILGGFVACLWLIAPKLVREVGILQSRLDTITENIIDLRSEYEKKYPELEEVMSEYLPQADMRDQMEKWRTQVRIELATVARQLFNFSINFLLAILFSYLILYDYFRLVKAVKSLRGSKLRDFYEEAGEPVVKFALAVGRGFQALTIIAFITTLFMIPVLLWFKVPSVTLLSVIVFLTSLVPVVGVVFEAVPIGLITLNNHGLNTAIWVLACVAVVHVVIGYVVAPVIFGRHFRLNVVLTLIILFLGGRFFGVWGVILGIPVANYLIRDVFAVPIVEELGSQKATEAVEKPKPVVEQPVAIQPDKPPA